VDLENIITWNDVKEGKATAIDYYTQNYPGMIRGDLYKANRKLYQLLRENGLLDNVLLKNES